MSFREREWKQWSNRSEEVRCGYGIAGVRRAPGPRAAAFANTPPGLMVPAPVCTIGETSGAHINPAVTIAFSHNAAITVVGYVAWARPAIARRRSGGPGAVIHPGEGNDKF